MDHLWVDKSANDCLWAEGLSCHRAVTILNIPIYLCIMTIICNWKYPSFYTTLKWWCLLASLFSCLKGVNCFWNFENFNQVLTSKICMLLAIVNLMLAWGGADRYPMRPTAWWYWNDGLKQLFACNVCAIVACCLSEVVNNFIILLCIYQPYFNY